MRRNFFASVIVATVATVVMGGGCNSSSSGGSSSNSATLKLVFIPKNMGNPYFDQVAAGLKSVSKDAGIDVDVEGPAKADPTSQLPTIKDQVQRAVDIIAISANDPAALDETLDDARSKGVTIVTVDSDLTGNETHRDLGVLPTDFSKIGPSQLEVLAKQMNYEGDFAILSAAADAPNQNAWIAGIKDALKDPKYSKMKLVDVVYGNDEAQKSSTEMTSLLTRYPTLKGVIVPTSVGLPAAAQVLANSGEYPGGPQAKNGGVILTGLSTPNQMKKMVDKGVVAQFQLWDPSQMGVIAGYLGAEIHNKKLDPKPGTTVDVPGIGKVTIGDKAVVYAGPLLTFDKSNIDKYNF